MRCLTLAKVLSGRGATCEFVVGGCGATLLETFGEGRFARHCYSDGETQPAIAALTGAQHYDALVLDDYHLAADAHRQIAGRVHAVVVIDDLADRPHDADLLIDPGHGRAARDYDGLAPDRCTRLVGPGFALVGPAFGAARDAALARPVAATPRRLFMSFGLSDVGGIAARAVGLVRAAGLGLDVEIALASGAASAPGLQALAATDRRLHPHLDARDVAALMASADMAIGAGGASTWERCTLGLPTLAVIVADNQRAMIEAMAADGALLAVDRTAADFEAQFSAALLRLVREDVRAALRARSAALCDGRGAERIADAILAL